MNPLNYMRLHDRLDDDPRQYWENTSNGKIRHYIQGMTLYDPQQHRASVFLYGDDAGVTCRCHAAWTLWYLGYPDQGLTQIDDAVTLAQHFAHPFSLGYTSTLAAGFHQFRREVRAAQEHAEREAPGSP